MAADTPVLQRTYEVVPEASEEFTALLWQSGSLGSHQTAAAGAEAAGELHRAYFAVGAAAPQLPPGVALVDEQAVRAADWMAAWRAQAEPIRIGRRLLVDPREPGPALARAPGRIRLRIPARSAFGTGGHESTRLVLELLENLPLAGARVLDVGTGAGLLALAAVALGAAEAVAFDLDLVAPILARHNLALNSDEVPAAARVRLFAGTTAALAERARFDLALVNVIPQEIESDLPRLAALLRPGAAAIFSGVLVTEGKGALARLRRGGFLRQRTRRAGDWVAYLCRRA